MLLEVANQVVPRSRCGYFYLFFKNDKKILQKIYVFSILWIFFPPQIVKIFPQKKPWTKVSHFKLVVQLQKYSNMKFSHVNFLHLQLLGAGC
jgi:hypothetical protein